MKVFSKRDINRDFRREEYRNCGAKRCAEGSSERDDDGGKGDENGAVKEMPTVVMKGETVVVVKDITTTTFKETQNLVEKETQKVVVGEETTKVVKETPTVVEKQMQTKVLKGTQMVQVKETTKVVVIEALDVVVKEALEVVVKEETVDSNLKRNFYSNRREAGVVGKVKYVGRGSYGDRGKADELCNLN